MSVPGLYKGTEFLSSFRFPLSDRVQKFQMKRILWGIVRVRQEEGVQDSDSSVAV
jgi:hypothetical protein